jgi:hypothetical protein
MVEGDIRDLETVEMAVEGIEAIVHQAALPSVPRSVRAPNTSNEVNVGGTLKLLTAAHSACIWLSAPPNSVPEPGSKSPQASRDTKQTRVRRLSTVLPQRLCAECGACAHGHVHPPLHRPDGFTRYQSTVRFRPSRNETDGS